MKTFFLGLGGSGAQVVMRTRRLLNEKIKNAPDKKSADILRKQRDAVGSIVIDTDKEAIDECNALGIKTIRLSNAGTVGNFITRLNDENSDVTKWCPADKRDSEFIGSKVDTGCSQSRLKSRLCLSGYLNDELNGLTEVFDSVQMADVESGRYSVRVMVISSIAGGTGSGIFIQLALYLKSYFRSRFNGDPEIIGLFACPDLYKRKVAPAEHTKIYANAYAVIRELNAINILCSSTDSVLKIGQNTKIEINTKSEGYLFGKDYKGKYGYKPYDTLYFIDETNETGNLLSSIEDYYNTMANIVYAHMFSSFRGKALSAENNELDPHIVRPLAIYGSAGSATMRYPYNENLNYLANRYLKDSISEVWTSFDDQWEREVEIKQKEAIATGQRTYSPTAKDRREHFINTYSNSVFGSKSVKANAKFSFLKNDLEDNENTSSSTKLSKFMTLLRSRAVEMIQNDQGLKKLKTKVGIRRDDVAATCNGIRDDISDGFSKGDDIFGNICTLDAGFDEYANACGSRLDDISRAMAMRIICNSPDLWDEFEKDDINIVAGLLTGSDKKMYHPLTVRYLLYSFRDEIEKNIKGFTGDDIQDEFAYIENAKSGLKELSDSNIKMFDPNQDDNENITNDKALDYIIRKFGGGNKAKAKMNDYEANFNENVDSLEKQAAGNVVFLALKRVVSDLDELIKQYEDIFDNLKKYENTLNKAIIDGEAEPNAAGEIVLYVGGTKEAKQSLYEKAKMIANPDSSDIISSISTTFYTTVRNLLWKNRTETGMSKTITGLFKSINEQMIESLKENEQLERITNKNIFEALLDEFRSTEEEAEEKLATFTTDSQSKVSVLNFLCEKIRDLAMRGAPMLQYDINDTYDAITTEKDENSERSSQVRVTVPYRYMEMNSGVAESIYDLFATEKDQGKAIESFMASCRDHLEGNIGQKPHDIVATTSDIISDKELFFYSMVHCLQPYQIPKFDEENNGIYFTNYCSCIAEMEANQKFSRTPHLDQTWHKRGMMPYVNVKKELESRYDIAKAFVYAVAAGKITRTTHEGFRCFRYLDTDPVSKNQRNELIIYNGELVRNFDFAKLIFWLSEQNALVDLYSARFDALLKNNVSALVADFNESIMGYEGKITTNKLVSTLREDIFHTSQSPVKLSEKSRKPYPYKKMGILKLATYLRKSEERYDDHDYAEEVVNVAEEVIYRFCSAPFGEQSLTSGSGKNQYQHMIDQQRGKFLEAYCEGENGETHETAVQTEDADNDKTDIVIDGTSIEDDFGESFGDENLSMDVDNKIPYAIRKYSSEILESPELDWLLAEFEVKKFKV